MEQTETNTQQQTTATETAVENNENNDGVSDDIDVNPLSTNLKFISSIM